MFSRISAALLSATFLVSPAFADPVKWGAHFDTEGRWSKARTLGDGGLFAPLWQNQNTLVFTDIRGKYDSQEGREGNFGFGVRHMLANGWNLGMYGYYDVRRSPLGNVFNQLTFGVEALSADWDLRINGYAPVGTNTHVIASYGGGASSVQMIGGNLQIVTPGSGQLIERAMGGVDGEIGWRAPVFDVDALTQVRLYAGAYHFSGGGVTPDITGPRGRIEFSVDDLFGFTNARLTLGGEFQHDDVRGSQAIATARLRIPLHNDKKAPRLNAQERRMTERVVRDVDIVSASGKSSDYRAPITERAVNAHNNEVVTSVTQLDAPTIASLQALLDEKGAGALVVLNGSVTGTSAVTMSYGQTLVGGGGALALRGETSGQTVNYVAPGAAGSIGISLGVYDYGATVGVLKLASSGVVSGLSIENTAPAEISGSTVYGMVVDASGTSNVHLLNNTITMAAGNFMVNLNDTTSAVFSGNTVTGTNSNSTAVRAFTSTDLTVSGNTLTAGMGLHATSATRATVANNMVIANGGAGHGMNLSGGSDLSVSGNNVTANGLYGTALQLFNFTGTSVVSGNTLTANGEEGDGVLVYGATTVSLVNNTITATGTAGQGAELNFATGASLSGNTISASGSHAYAVNMIGGDSSTLTDNTITASGSAAGGIYATMATATLSGNTVTSSTTSALSTDAYSNMIVTGNTFNVLDNSVVAVVADGGTLTFANNSFANANGIGVYADGAAFNAGSTGNVTSMQNSTRCNFTGAGTGTIGFVDGYACGY